MQICMASLYLYIPTYIYICRYIYRCLSFTVYSLKVFHTPDLSHRHECIVNMLSCCHSARCGKEKSKKIALHKRVFALIYRHRCIQNAVTHLFHVYSACFGSLCFHKKIELTAKILLAKYLTVFQTFHKCYFIGLFGIRIFPP